MLPLWSRAQLQVPQPGRGEMLIRVHAAGLTPTELLWYPTTHTPDGGRRTSAIPSHEFSGVVEAVVEDVDPNQIGREVFGMNDCCGPICKSVRQISESSA